MNTAGQTPPPQTDDIAVDLEDAEQQVQALLDGVLKSMQSEPGIDDKQLADKSKEMLGELEPELTDEGLAWVDPVAETAPAMRWRVRALNLIRLLLASVFLIAGLGITAIFIAKLFGRLEDWSYGPWFLAAMLSFLGIGGVGVIVERLESRQIAKRQVAAERGIRRLEEELLLQVVEPARNQLRTAAWKGPEQDLVTITTSKFLSARIDRPQRVLTAPYQQVRLHLKREGGAAVGLSGPRGAGKTELLREFCVIPEGATTVAHGGKIGVLLSAPRAFPPQAFISLTIRKLCEEVPGYSDLFVGPTLRTWSTIRQALLWGFALVAVAAGFYMFDPSLLGAADLERRTLGQVLLGLGLLFLLVLVVRETLRYRNTSFVRLLEGFRPLYSGDPGERAAQLERQDAAAYARQVARRMRFVETRTTTGEASGGAGGFTAKLSHQMRLEEMPMSEADLVEEFRSLVDRLNDVGYEVVIGIDELDKLEADEEAEDFLNGLKSLFTVKNCSFLVSVSESAWGKFAQRGILIRDTFDSSLDEVVIVEAPTLSQARAFLKLREPELTDSQVLFCYCLSGGIPRDLLRAARKLGETNQAMPGEENFLDEVGHRVLANDAKRKINAALLSARSLPPGESTGQYELDLELLRDPRGRGDRARQRLIAADAEFAALLDQDAAVDGIDDPEPVEDTAQGAQPGGNAAESEQPQAKRTGTLREQRRRTFTYLLLLDRLERAFTKPGLVAKLPSALDPPKKDLACFLGLAEARRRLETSAASSWLIVQRVSDQFHLVDDEGPEGNGDGVEVVVHDEGPVSAAAELPEGP